MKLLVVFYSYTGNTKQLAEKISNDAKADLYEIQDKKRPGTMKAYIAGSLSAKMQKKWAIKQNIVDLSPYEKIIIMAPVWFGFPAPQLNSFIDLLPSGKSVEVIMVSASGQSNCRDALTARIRAKGCEVSGFQDVKN